MHILFAIILLSYIPSITRHGWHKIPGYRNIIKYLGKYSYVPCLVGFRRFRPLCAFNFIEDWLLKECLDVLQLVVL